MYLPVILPRIVFRYNATACCDVKSKMPDWLLPFRTLVAIYVIIILFRFPNQFRIMQMQSKKNNKKTIIRIVFTTIFAYIAKKRKYLIILSE